MTLYLYVQYAETLSILNDTQTYHVLIGNVNVFQLPGEEEGHGELNEVATPEEVEKLSS